MSLTRKKILGFGGILLVIALLFSIMTVFADETGSTDGTEKVGVWTEVAPMNEARRNLQAVVVDGKIYAIGGYNTNGVVNTIEEYDPETNTWTIKTPMDLARTGFQAIVVDGKIYAIGGYDGSSSIRNVQEYNPETNKWTTKAPMTSARKDFAAVVVDGKIYAIGGYSVNSIVNTVEEYNPETDTWATKASMPSARKDHQAVVINGKIYVIGGSGNGSILVQEYNPETDTWATKASMALARTYHRVAVVNGKIYIFGGSNSSVEEYDPAVNSMTTKTPMNTKDSPEVVVTGGKIYVVGGKSSDILQSLEEYDPGTNTWKIKDFMHIARCGHQTALVDGKIYAIGGYSNGNSALNSVEVYTPENTTPIVPANLAATAGDTKVDLSWTAADGAISYTIKRATTSGGPYEAIAADITDTTYTDTNVINGTTYYYVVTAVTTGGESENSNEASATPHAATTPEEPETGNALLEITMTDGSEKEYELTMSEANDFIDWFDDKSAGTGSAYYIFDKDYNKGPFASRKDYLVFDKIQNFEVNQYE